IHFNVEVAIVEYLCNVQCASDIRELELDFSTDGCTLDRSGTIQIWPIQCRISNLQNSKPVVGIYKGAQKLTNANAFFEKFIIDITAIICNGGINFHGALIPVRLRAFVADAPARAFLLHHRAHTSYHSCSKCKVHGMQIDGRCVFNGIKHPLRTDENYRLCHDVNHHKEGTSPLAVLSMRMVSQVPFEYMHLVCLGVVKKLLSAWVHGKYSRILKLCGRSISRISDRLKILIQYCPTEFARCSRSLDIFSKFKATEFRQFLLYTGPVVMYGILDDHLYKHFLLLHTAIRILLLKSPSEKQLRFAELALEKFVLRNNTLYGSNFISYNVHGLLHLTNDVKRLGNLESFSAFPYENNISIFRKYCRKPGQPLQQLFNRMTELRLHGRGDNRDIAISRYRDMSVRVSIPCSNSDTSVHYSKITFNSICLGTHVRDNCCILRDGSICIVVDIIADTGSYSLIVKRFLEVDNFFNVGLPSSAFHVYLCSNIS
ncbi:hypothetical protein EAI_05511, partial [Harpegnathos saltator]